VERPGGILRRLIPKGTSIGSLDGGEIAAAELAMNALPRRILGYRTPDELFEERLDELYGAPAV
jgi:IS30 family transposase